MSKHYKVLQILSSLVILTMLLSGFQLPAVSAQGKDGAKREHNAQTGKLSFIGPESGRSLSSKALGLSPSALKADPAAALVQRFGPEFGLKDPANELAAMKSSRSSDGRRTVRFQQRYAGIPVMAGELIVNTNDNGDLYSMNGEISPDLSLSTQPGVDAAQARQTALEAVAKWYKHTPEDFVTTEPQLWILDESLLLSSTRPAELVWRMDVTPKDLALPVRELVLVNAIGGGISLHFNQVDTAWGKLGQKPASAPAAQASSPGATGSPDVQTRTGGLARTYTANDNPAIALPGTLLCDQTSPNCTNGANPHADSAHRYALGTYDLYQAKHGRLSINNANMTLISTVHFCPSASDCPYFNANWTGSQMIYGDAAGFPLADDIVAHELTHGVTQYESNLYYYYPSGAINESLSDLWGEYYDQTNGLGTDTVGVKWLLGEDVTGLGPARSMSDPAASPYFDPDRMSSPYYFTDYTDNGGVHYNSGINNKAVFLMVDGQFFNGITVIGIGWDKTAAVYYEANTNLLPSGADYSDLYYALQQACTNLIGGAKGITSGDCAQVKNAIDAVEMNEQPAVYPDFNTDPPKCAPGEVIGNTLLSDGLEAGRTKWTFVNGSYTHWQRDAPPAYGSYAHTGSHYLYGDDWPPVRSTPYARLVAVTLPARAYLYFEHAYGFETERDEFGNLVGYNDGGLLEYSINGGTSWIDADPLIDENGYNGSITTAYDNPLMGHTAFVGESHGYIGTRVDLTGLAGKKILFRWRMALDTGVYARGWWVDDVKIYTCQDGIAPAAITNLNATSGATGGRVNLSWTAPGDDGATGTAASYLVRYSTTAITNDTQWNAATAVTTGVPAPALAGTAQNMTVSGLMPGTTYYFAVRAQDEMPNLAALSNSASAAAQSMIPLVAGSYDDPDLNLLFLGTWTTYTGAGPYGNTNHYSNVVGSDAWFSFNGNKFRLTYVKASNRGNIDVYVDGSKVATINAYAATTSWQQTWMSPVYGIGVHNVRLVHAGASGKFIDVDRIEIFYPLDSVPPAAISSLSAGTSATTGAVNLGWAAPGDDGNSGTATNYLVRYSSSAITNETEWNAATPVLTGIPTPLVAGSAQYMTVTGLTPGNTYYFSVRAQDEEPNTAALSNSPSAVAQTPVPVSPGKYDDTDINWTYSGTWTVYTGAGPYNNTNHYSTAVGAEAVISFNGSKFRLTYVKASNRGNIDVYVDGNLVTTINAYAATTSWQQTWMSPVFPNGYHLVRLVHAGASGKYIDIDAIEMFVPLDPNPPAAISSLSATTGTTTGSVNLQWTAPGDDGGSGTATNYLVRYSASAITNETQWNAATPVSTGIPTPLVAGSTQTMTVTGLTPGATYYFAVRAQDEEPNTAALSNSPGVAAQTVVPVGAGTYDDTDVNWIYTGTWTAYTGAGPYNSTNHYTNVVGAEAQISFNGTGFRLTYVKASNRGSIQVYVDGSPAGTINAMATTTSWQQTWTSPTYTNGAHTVRFVHAGGGTYIDVDAITILAPPTPVGAGTYDNTDTHWIYTGSWTASTGSGPYLNTWRTSNTVGDEAQITFTGTGFVFTYVKASNRGNIDVYVDGTPVGTINAANPTLVWQATWPSGTFSAGTHTVRFVHASGTYIDVDAITILP